MPFSNLRQRSTYLFLALVVVIILGGIIGIEALRRLSARQNTAPPNLYPASVSERARTPFPRQLRDASGGVVTIKARPVRIASTTLSTDEILLAICTPERIKGFSKFALDAKYSNVVSEVRATGSPIVENAEQILQIEPDLIFVASYSRPETVEQLQAAGATVFRFANFISIEDIKQNIRTVGYSIGEDERAEALVAQMDRDLGQIRARVPKVDSAPRVLSYSADGYTAGSGTLFDDILRTAGAINVAAEHGLDGFPKINAEQVADWQPDFIVAGADAGQFEETRRRLLMNPAVATTRAARANRIIIMDNRYFLTVSQYVVRAVGTLVDGLYAEQPGTSQ
ncbi:MAG TPA: ABC transporter substrate-binding protein [Pyrinomonadaceae bacterium]